MNAPLQKPVMDDALLAKLTGRLGDRQTVERLSAALSTVYAEFLPDIIKSETDLDITVAYIGCETGYKNELIAGLDANTTLADATLRNWSQNVTLACGNSFVITLMEHLLGALPETVEVPADRPLSSIEMELAVMVFEKIANVLRSAVDARGGFEPLIEPPHDIQQRPKPHADRKDEFAASITMSVTLSGITSEFSLIVPQAALLKTVIAAPKPKSQSSKSKDWADQLSEQVRRSSITLNAKIHLQDLTLRTISKLAAGDVIPFRDSGDVRVDVSANGKDLYVCEFGRSGENYTVRVKDTMNTEDELLRHLMN